MDDHSLVALAAQLAQQAGSAILAIRRHGFKTVSKPDQSPVTDADIASQRLILAGLESATPDIPVVAEELPDSAVHLARPCFWLVDPLDGTREFAAGLDEFVVAIGLVRDRRVVLGAVAAPATGELFTGIVGQGAWKHIEGDNCRIRVREVPPGGAVALISRHDANDPGIRPKLEGRAIARTIEMGSAIKFCRIAEGAADFYPRPGRTMEWDTGAPQAILEAAGGAVLTSDGQPLTYGKANWENPSFLCTGGRPRAE